jgi:hypothetical protein
VLQACGAGPSSDVGPVLTSTKSLERDIQFQEEMMRMSCRWTGLRTMVLGLGFLAFAASSGQAAAIMNYSTAGSIDSAGISGPPIISFVPVSNGSFNSPSAFSLGDFQVAALPAGQTTTYTDVPFHITFLANTVNGSAPNPNETPIQVSGKLSGTVTGSDQSDVLAKFDPIVTPTFLTGQYSNTISIVDSPLSLVPSTTNNGQTSAQAHLDTTNIGPPVPEPTSIALFLTTLAGLGVRHRLRNRQTV